MLDALGAGLVAGYAIAVPMGPITVLILQAGLRHGLRTRWQLPPALRRRTASTPRWPGSSVRPWPESSTR
jgi:hypothetical protein